jgi:hypothetical protein
MQFFAGKSLALNFGVTVATDFICRPGIGVRVLYHEIVMADAPTFLGMAVDLSIPNDDNRENAKSARESGPETVPTSAFVERAGPSKGVMEERVETVHQRPHFVMPPRLIFEALAKTDAQSIAPRERDGYSAAVAHGVSPMTESCFVLGNHWREDNSDR